MFFKFIAKHRFISFVIISAVVCGLYSGLLYLSHVHFILMLILDLLLLFLIFIFVELSFVIVLKKPLEELNNKCDPYPILEALKWLLSIKLSNYSVHLIKLQYSNALNAIREMQEAYDVVSSINVEEIHSDLTRLRYYESLFIANLNVGKKEKLADCLSEYKQVYSNIKSERAKKAASSGLYYLESLLLRENKDYRKALEILDRCESNTLYSMVVKAHQSGKLYLDLDEKEKAKEMLDFVINNGNKLFVVDDARELLSNI